MSERFEGMSEERFAEEVARQASAFPYPATPDSASAVVKRLDQERSSRSLSFRPFPVRRLAMVLAMLLLLLAGLLAIPPVRAAVWRALRIGAIQINLLEEPDARLLPTPEAASIVDLGIPVSLAEAADLFAGAIRWPPALGEPDWLYHQELAGFAPVITLVWLDDVEAGNAQILLSHFGAGNIGLKLAAGEQVREVQVNGRAAVWIEDAHLLQLEDGSSTAIAQANNVLIWSVGEVTYRLESQLTLPEAQTLAESLR